MTTKSIRTDLPPESPYGMEHDACALYLSARKNGQSTFGTLKRALYRLANMGHRTGYVNGEGDGAGVQTDIPRGLWAKKISQAGLPATLTTQPGFWVGHLFIPSETNYQAIEEKITGQFTSAGLNLLLAQPGPVRFEALGLNAQFDPPVFYQLAGSGGVEDLEKRLYAVKTALESDLPIHFASLSSYTVIYKIRGSVEILSRYYPELQDYSYDTVMALCHARYSTNTVSTFERSQPFALLGHNGEINTINQFRREARQMDIVLPRGGSDSQDVDRALESLCVEKDLSLMEAMELVFPPSPHETGLLPSPMKEIYERGNRVFGPFAQGPAAIGARYGDLAVCSLDNLGLRPLWFSETEKEYIFSSERGAIFLEDMVADSRPLAPGEKMGFSLQRGQGVQVLSHQDIRQHVMNSALKRDSFSSALMPASTPRQENNTQNAPSLPWLQEGMEVAIDGNILSAVGWNKDHVKDVREQALTGKDPVGSMGFDGPLAAFSKDIVNLADFFKETVAVVTNPAVDRGREYEVFSTAMLIGSRPAVGSPASGDSRCMVLDSPLLSGGVKGLGIDPFAPGDFRTIESVLAGFKGAYSILSLAYQEDDSVQDALTTLTNTAVDAVRSGSRCLVLDDTPALINGLPFIDPLLASAAIDDALSTTAGAGNLRRNAGLIIRSAAVRSLHDIILLCSFGADAVNPYAMLSLAAGAAESPNESIENVLNTLQVGLEKVISTIGCHELRGYGRISASIGFSPEIAAFFQSPNFLGSQEAGLSWHHLKADALERMKILRSSDEKKLTTISRFYPKVWKSLNSYLTRQSGYEAVTNAYAQAEEKNPVALRHIMRFTKAAEKDSPRDIDISVNGYDLPFVISAMSFGSQGELSYKSYAQAAKELNIITLNGEGGELPEMLGKFRKHRGQQVASGRFGVNAAFLNSTDLIEIKIGQGAKPGEGGMLPAEKVNPQVAEARHTPPYMPLLSPSNNHDLYSIEDLAQLIEELKTVNPEAKISVKCPCVPGIGVIAVGVAKAGADIINLSGYDGATGAARKHAIQNVGLPAEIGVTQAHRALVDAGIRRKVEIWCDGGMKTGSDVVKMILLGANRVGFGSMAMIAIGCTVCRRCNEGTCHMGITTHIKTIEEAREMGLKRFTPRNFEQCVDRLIHLFTGMADEVRQITANLGASSLQDLVGRADLLEQTAFTDRIDLTDMLAPVPIAPRKKQKPGVGRLLVRDRNHLTRFISETVLEAVDDGESEVTYQDQVMAYDRALGSHLFGALSREPDISTGVDLLHLHFSPSSIGGNGFAAWSNGRTDVLIEGGAQDGVAKGASGGRVAVMKGLNHEGQRIDGSVGKSFAYGAQGGKLYVQGDADSRACIRLSGADVVLGGRITKPVNGRVGGVGAAANLKGFACEYMTSGRVVILGDPGPYAFAGMTGGVVYQLLTPEMGFTVDVLTSRFAKGAHVKIAPVEEADVDEIKELLLGYREALMQTNQPDEAREIASLCLPQMAASRFVKVLPDW